MKPMFTTLLFYRASKSHPTQGVRDTRLATDTEGSSPPHPGQGGMDQHLEWALASVLEVGMADLVPGE